LRHFANVLVLLFLIVALVISANSILPVKAEGNVVLLNHTGFKEYYYGGAYHVFGEVQNIGDQAAGYNITATFYNSKDEVVVISYISDSRWYDDIHGDGNSRAFSYLTVLQPNAKSPFELYLPSGWVDITQIDHYVLKVKTLPANHFFFGLQIISQSLHNSGGDLYIDCEIRNTGSSSMDEVKVVATFYNETGKVVAAGSVGTGYSPEGNEPGFHPNQTEPFSLRLATGILSAVFPVVDHYELRAEGYTYADKTTYCLGSALMPQPNQVAGLPFELYMGIVIIIIIVIIVVVPSQEAKEQERQ
jgi:hypothetical protein